jgi:pyroglutamyl-peptidase
MKLLVTGFGAFPGVPANLTGTLVAEWQNKHPNWPFSEMYFEVLPTSYERAGASVSALIKDLHPDFVLMLGVGDVRAMVQLERFAVNIDDCIVADVFGLVREGLTIASDCPAALKTPIDVSRLRQLLALKDIFSEISNHAGTYVCNHAYFVALREAALVKKPTNVLFAHLPGGYNILSPKDMRRLTDEARTSISELAYNMATIELL